MAKCDYCKKEMLKAKSCTFSRIKINGRIYKRMATDEEGNDEGFKCHDCGIIMNQGNYHHFGCDIEECPVCKTQIISCNCEKNCLLK